MLVDNCPVCGKKLELLGKEIGERGEECLEYGCRDCNWKMESINVP